MKSCDEMVNSLLERKSVYEAEQKRKKKITTRAVTSLCCICLVAVLGIGINKSGLLDSKPPVEQENNYIQTTSITVTNGAKGEKDEIIKSDESIGDYTELKSEATYPNEIKTEKVSKPYYTNGNIINIQPITGGLPAAKMNICLLVEDFISMSQEEMIEYYGVDYIPDVPEDIKPWENEVSSGIFRRNGGTGEVYWDKDILNFSNEDFTREVHLEIAKGHIPFCDYLHFDGMEKMSVINGTEVYIGLTDSGYYYTEFMYKEAGFRIDANGVTEEEFVAIIASLIE